jgi:hypothetical protein
MSAQLSRIKTVAVSYAVLAVSKLAGLAMVVSGSWSGSVTSVANAPGVLPILVKLAMLSAAFCLLAWGVLKFERLAAGPRLALLALALLIPALSLVELIALNAETSPLGPASLGPSSLPRGSINLAIYALCAYGVWSLWRQRLTKRWSGP